MSNLSTSLKMNILYLLPFICFYQSMFSKQLYIFVSHISFPLVTFFQMSRIGLQQLSTSARNSPLIKADNITFDKVTKGLAEPLKLTKRYQPVVPSPLAATSPFNVFGAENKENVETQTFEVR